jgi:hypothetical protein
MATGHKAVADVDTIDRTAADENRCIVWREPVGPSADVQ